MQVSLERRIELGLGDDLTDAELTDAWLSSSASGYRDLADFKSGDPGQIKEHDVPLWKAKVRYDAGRLTGLLDAIAICNEAGQPLPFWANEDVTAVVAGRMKSQEDSFSREGANEVPELIGQAQAEFVVHLLAWHRRTLPNLSYSKNWKDQAIADLQKAIEWRTVQREANEPEKPTLANTMTPIFDLPWQSGRKFWDERERFHRKKMASFDQYLEEPLIGSLLKGLPVR